MDRELYEVYLKFDGMADSLERIAKALEQLVAEYKAAHDRADYLDKLR